MNSPNLIVIAIRVNQLNEISHITDSPRYSRMGTGVIPWSPLRKAQRLLGKASKWS